MIQTWFLDPPKYMQIPPSEAGRRTQKTLGFPQYGAPREGGDLHVLLAGPKRPSLDLRAYGTLPAARVPSLPPGLRTPVLGYRSPARVACGHPPRTPGKASGTIQSPCLPFPVEESTESEPSSGNRHYPVAAAIQRAGQPETEVPDKPVLTPRAVPGNKNVVTPWGGTT